MRLARTRASAAARRGGTCARSLFRWASGRSSAFPSGRCGNHYPNHARHATQPAVRAPQRMTTVPSSKPSVFVRIARWCMAHRWQTFAAWVRRARSPRSSSARPSARATSRASGCPTRSPRRLRPARRARAAGQRRHRPARLRRADRHAARRAGARADARIAGARARRQDRRRASPTRGRGRPADARRAHRRLDDHLQGRVSGLQAEGLPARAGGARSTRAATSCAIEHGGFGAETVRFTEQQGSVSSSASSPPR